MKQITLIICLLISGISMAQNQQKEYQQEARYPQDAAGYTSEIKLNALSLIALSSLDVSYEKILNKDSSFGVAMFYNFNDVDDEMFFPKSFSLTPYYRWFSPESRVARGFFVEGFGMLNTFKGYSYEYDYETNNGRDVYHTETSFALGISVGGKFVTRSRFTTEVYLGVGRNIFRGEDNNDFLETNIVGRFGISLGYRF